MRQSGVRVYTMRDVDKHGIARVIEMAIEAVGSNLDCPLHLSLDIDSVDPHFAPGTGTAARGGLSYREIHYICVRSQGPLQRSSSPSPLQPSTSPRALIHEPSS